MRRKALLSSLLPLAGFILISLVPNQAATILQTNSQNSTGDNWNATAAWGGTAPIGTNDYVTNAAATGAFAATATGLGSTVTSRVRNTATTPFGGNSLTIVSSTELLLRGNGTTSSGNIIVNGGTVRSVFSSALTGNLSTITTGIVGLGGTNTLTINSALTGSGTFFLRSSDGTPTIRFGGDLSGFTGTLQIGGGGAAPGVVTLDFDQNYTLLASIVMGTAGTLDVLNLDQAITVNSFQFGATILAPHQYTVAELNALPGVVGSQFTGNGTLTVVPEPSALLLGGLSSFLLIRRRRVA
ncbi:hypothetical protein [Haloferula sp. BvORR071]|uniref:hypothetical protein n=1 Tax=Haloferula sp. BvORR071 TaxID=1396141 RepID=UPI002241026A|nr:hypothetical protein [Haloferula sp. BvORR071]